VFGGVFRHSAHRVAGRLEVLHQRVLDQATENFCGGTVLVNFPAILSGEGSKRRFEVPFLP